MKICNYKCITKRIMENKNVTVRQLMNFHKGWNDFYNFLTQNKGLGYCNLFRISHKNFEKMMSPGWARTTNCAPGEWQKEGGNQLYYLQKRKNELQKETMDYFNSSTICSLPSLPYQVCYFQQLFFVYFYRKLRILFLRIFQR